MKVVNKELIPGCDTFLKYSALFELDGLSILKVEHGEESGFQTLHGN